MEKQSDSQVDCLEKQLEDLSKLMTAFDLGKNHENSDDNTSEKNDLVYGFSSDDEYEEPPQENPFNVKIEEEPESSSRFKRKKTTEGLEKEFYRQKFEKIPSQFIPEHRFSSIPEILDIDCVNDPSSLIRDWYNINSTLIQLNDKKFCQIRLTLESLLFFKTIEQSLDERGEIEETIKSLEKLAKSSKSWADQVEEEDELEAQQTQHEIQAQAQSQNTLPESKGMASQPLGKNLPLKLETVQTEDSPSISKDKAQKAQDPIDQQIDNSKKAYVIFDGPMKGVYQNWSIAKLHIIGKPVRHKSYPSIEEAKEAYQKVYKTISTEDGITSNKEMGYSRRFSSLEKIQEKLKGTSSEPNESEFYRNWRWVTEYSEEISKECFYPIVNNTGAKAVFLPGANPAILSSFFNNGLITTIYLQEDPSKSYDEISQLPSGIRKMAQQFNKLFAKGKEIYLKVQSTYPMFEDDKIIKPKHLVKIGMANGLYPEIQQKNIKFSLNYFVEQINQFYNYSRQFGTTQAGFKILAEEEGLIVFSHTNKKATEHTIEKMVKFEEDLITLTGNFSKIPEEVKRIICNQLQRYKSHKCQLCPEDFPPLKEEEKETSEEMDDLLNTPDSN
ncbi:transactivator/viroplasmin protein [Striga asiatica]|uniref:Transactivator/viroplasmin protein n=1 Tax=Striga asiatica TaxID=4170 RepID=A0A5A7PYU1_STRAF|nr:transactivator/viroplasmin protein [Striga asiatica]